MTLLWAQASSFEVSSPSPVRSSWPGVVTVTSEGEETQVDSGREGGVPATEVDGWGEAVEAGDDILGE